MNQKVSLKNIMLGNIESVREIAQKCVVSSRWQWEHYRNGKLIDQWHETNICTDEGLNALLNIMFHAITQITTWYLLIFETDTVPAAGTTYAVPVFTECEAYDEGTREEFLESAASSKSLSNSANKAEFTINDDKTIYGAALVGGGTDADTKGDVGGGGTMYAASKFAASKIVESGDVLKVTCTLTASDV